MFLVFYFKKVSNEEYAIRSNEFYLNLWWGSSWFEPRRGLAAFIHVSL